MRATDAARRLIPRMAEPDTLITPRLRLRPWRDADLAPFAALNADPEVMAHFPAPLTRAESDALAARGWGLWAVEVPGGCAFAGYVGLAEPRFEASFTRCLEIGWRLARAQWGRGYATEGARAALRFAFDELGRDEVVSFTTVANARSRAVMERLGMRRDPADDFDHPVIAVGHPLRRHVLYRVRRGVPNAAG
jgi:RimJ/RimL family protein N-acetyltransferase